VKALGSGGPAKKTDKGGWHQHYGCAGGAGAADSHWRQHFAQEGAQSAWQPHSVYGSTSSTGSCLIEGHTLDAGLETHNAAPRSLCGSKSPQPATSQWAFLTPMPTMSQQDASSARAKLEISVANEAANSTIPPIASFQELGGALPPYVTDALREAGMLAPMAIQAQALPIVLSGFDLIGIAKTGSGKTLAFLLPAIAHIEAQQCIVPGEATPVAVALAPVRELAVQIAEEANKLLSASTSESHPKGIGAVALFGGGQNVRWRQVKELQRGWCQIVVGTPGRICDFLGTGELSLHRVTCFVLDEADRMLEEGFGEQMSAIQAAVRPDRQTLFFSATWPPEVQKLAAMMCHSMPICVTVGQNETGTGPTTRSDIIQEVVVFDGGTWDEITAQKRKRLDEHLRALLQVEAFKILVFVNMKSLAWELAGQLNDDGFKADFMYGGRSQDARHEVVEKLKHGTIKLLVTTDVMARGLDIPGISHVVVYDCYGGIDEYVHRIGRTARGPYGSGHALTFYEYDPKYSEFPAELIGVLEQAGQEVPEPLRTIAEEVASGQRRAKWKRKW